MQQRSAHENPVIFYSMAIGFLGKSTPQPPNLKFSQLALLGNLLEDCWLWIWRIVGVQKNGS